MPAHPAATAEQLAPNAADLRERIRHLVETGHVDDARSLVHEAVTGGMAARDLGPWLRVFFPPKAITRPATARGDFIANMQWVEAHRDAHRGAWLAMRDGALVDSDPSRAALRERLARDGKLDGALFVKVDP
jgi:hypothetical protein